MRKKAFLFGIAFCLILIPLGLWRISHPECTGLLQRLSHNIVLQEKDNIGPDIRFRVRMMGSGRTPEGYSTDFTDVRSSDCVEITSETVSTDSSAQAESELKKEKHAAARILEESKVDLPNHPNGDRAVLLFVWRKEIVLWFKGEKTLHKIESSSLAHALAYEKLMQRGRRLDAEGYIIATDQ